MADPIDDLFVRLGLETDQKEFNDAKREFDGLKSTVLQFGAAIGTGFGLKELTFGFSEATDEIARFAEVFDIDPAFLDQLTFAFQQTGGSAQDAFQSIRNIADIIEQTEWGEISESAFREFGVDPLLLEGVSGIAESYERIVAAAQNMDPETARRFFGAMGLSESDLRLSRGTGDQSFSALMEEAGQLAQMNQDMMDQARDFQLSIGRSSRALEGISREISSLFVGDLAEAIDRLADFLSDNRDEIRGFFKEAMPIIKGAGASLAVIASIQAARASIGVLRNIPGATIAAAALGGAVVKMREEQEQSRQEYIDQYGGGMGNQNYQPAPMSPDEIPTMQDVPGQNNQTSIENSFRIEVNGSGDPDRVASVVLEKIRDWTRDTQDYTRAAAS